MALKLRRLLSAAHQVYKGRTVVKNPAGAFLAFLHDSAMPSIRCAYRKTWNFSSRPADWLAVREVLFDEEYRFCRNLCGPEGPSTILDCGANIGLFSIYCLSLFPEASVHAVEPSLETYKVLEANRSANSSCDWHVYRFALWNHDGEVQFENRPFSTSSRIAEDVPGNETVPSITLGTLFAAIGAPVIDILKLDVEGAEEKVLTGNEEVLGRIQNLIVEIHPYACDQQRVLSALRNTFDRLYLIPGRRSSKPLVLASRRELPFPDMHV